MSEPQPTRVVIVCPTLLRNDAVGEATLNMARDLAADPHNQVTLVCRNSDPHEFEVTRVRSLADLLLTPAFLEADVVIYVFAIFNELFDAILLGNGRARQIVRFHNVTPKALVGEADHPIIDRSMAQIQNFAAADELWADSQENRDELLRQGLAPDRIRVMDLAVTPHTVARLARKARRPIDIVYVGRFVQSKGVHELLEALALLRDRSPVRFRARLLGNTRHASPDYIAHLDKLMTDLDLQDHVDLGGTVSDEALAEAYGQAHVFATASRHEGFCVPVIEGLAAGCVPVSYANSNLHYIGGGLGRLAAEETPSALADALASVIGDIDRSLAHKDATAVLNLDRGALSIAAFDAAARAHVAGFSRSRAADRMRERLTALTAPTNTDAIMV